MPPRMRQAGGRLKLAMTQERILEDSPRIMLMFIVQAIREYAEGMGLPDSFLTHIKGHIKENSDGSAELQVRNTWFRVDDRTGRKVHLGAIYEKGAPPHEILPRKKKAMRWFEYTTTRQESQRLGLGIKSGPDGSPTADPGEAYAVFSRRVWHPGTPAYQAMRQGYLAGKRRYVRWVKSGLSIAQFMERSKSRRRVRTAIERKGSPIRVPHPRFSRKTRDAFLAEVKWVEEEYSGAIMRHKRTMGIIEARINKERSLRSRIKQADRKIKQIERAGGKDAVGKIRGLKLFRSRLSKGISGVNWASQQNKIKRRLLTLESGFGMERGEIYQRWASYEHRGGTGGLSQAHRAREAKNPNRPWHVARREAAGRREAARIARKRATVAKGKRTRARRAMYRGARSMRSPLRGLAAFRGRMTPDEALEHAEASRARAASHEVGIGRSTMGAGRILGRPGRGARREKTEKERAEEADREAYRFYEEMREERRRERAREAQEQTSFGREEDPEEERRRERAYDTSGDDSGGDGGGGQTFEEYMNQQRAYDNAGREERERMDEEFRRRTSEHAGRARVNTNRGSMGRPTSIRNAYLSLTRRFHPDKWRAREPNQNWDKMNSVFGRITTITKDAMSNNRDFAWWDSEINRLFLKERVNRDA